MQAIVLSETGGVDKLRWESIPAPDPTDGQVLLRVHAAAINPVDWKYRRGLIDTRLPMVPGSDVSGVVEVSRSADFAVGDAVCGMAASGAYAELATANERHLVHKPHGVTHERAAAVPVSGLTAWQTLFDGGALDQGRMVVIAGAAGGVGHLAVQFSTLAGAHVVGTGSARNRDFVLGLGAHRYVDYTRSGVADVVQDADVVVDTVGGTTTQSLVPAIRPGGTLVSIAYPTPADWPGIEAFSRTAGVRAELVVMRPDRSQLQHIIDLVADGTVRVEIADVLPLTEAGLAQLRSESGHTRGKLVLRVDRR